MKNFILLIISFVGFVQLHGQGVCREAIACEEQVKVTASHLAALTPLTFLEMEWEDFNACEKEDYLFEIEISDLQGKIVIESVERHEVGCSLEMGDYTVTVFKIKINTDGTKSVENSCFSSLTIDDANNVCGSTSIDPSLLNTCAGSELIGMAGDIVEAEKGIEICVPFRSRNFDDFSFFQTDLIWNNEVLSFTKLNAGAIPLSSNDFNSGKSDKGVLRFSWLSTDPNRTITLDDDEVLFEVCFEVVGEPGQSSLVRMVEPYQNFIEIGHVKDGVMVADEYCLTPALVNIPGDISEDGNYTMTLNGQSITLQDFNAGQINTDLLLDGDNTVEFQVPESEDFLDLILGGISTLDLVLGIKMFVTDEPIDPLSAIALDVDYNGGINVKDLVLIRQLILGQRRTLPSPGYFFIERSEVFGEDFDEFDFGFFDTYVYDRAVVEQGDLFFDVYKYGDLSRNQFAGEQDAEIRSNDPGYISFENKYVNAGEVVTTKFTIDSEGAYAINGIQSSLEAIGAEIIEVKHNYFGDEFFFHITDDNKLNLLFASNTSKEKLEFEVVVTFDADGYLSDKFSLSQDFHKEIVKNDLSVTSLELLPVNVKAKEFKIVPNPFTEYTRIDIPKEFVGGSLYLTNVLGAKIYNSRIPDNEFVLTSDAIGRSGVYMVTLESGTQTLTKRLVFQE